MKKFLLHSILLALVFLVIVQVPRLFVSKFYGNDVFTNKLKALSQDEQDYEAFFLGTSRVNNQINPQLFERLSNVKSYNLGCPGTSGIENLKLLRHILNQENPSLKYVFVEFPFVNLHAEENANAVRSMYFLDRKSISLYKAFLKHNDFSPLEQVQHLFSRAILPFLKKNLGISVFRAQLTALYNSSRNLKADPDQGYSPLKVGTNKAQHIQRREDFLKNTSILQTRKDDALNVLKEEKKLKPNAALLAEIKDLNQLAKSKRIKIVYMVLPRNPGLVYENTLPVYNKLSDKQKIKILDPRKFPEYYSEAYAYDKGHLNAKGSALLTTEIAEQFLQLNAK